MMLRIVLATALLVLACTPTASDPPAATTHDPAPQVAVPQVTKPDAVEPKNTEPERTRRIKRPVSEPVIPMPDTWDPEASAGCPEPAPRIEFDSCRAVELTGEGPCEEVCKEFQPDRNTECCAGATEVVVFSGSDELLRVSACAVVPPDCAHAHGHGNWDANLRVLRGPPVELVLVEGGCEMRALAHGYVPPGVAAWSGCVHKRYRWDGERLVEVER